MVSSKAKTVPEYLKSLPEDRRAALSALRKLIRANLPAGFEEKMSYGMIGYQIPLARFSNTYNGQPIGIAALASQKNYMALYLMGVYGDKKIEAWFRGAFKKAGKKLDMGKSCVRFKTLDALPLPVIGEVIGMVSAEDLIAAYESAHGSIRQVRAKRKLASSKRA